MNAEKLTAELENESMKSAIVRAGFAKQDPYFLGLFIANFRRFANRIGW